MATYAIGDVQGCFKPLLSLLENINFNDKTDDLWFAGDLINRGPDSLATLRFIYSLGDKAKVVLGNHDLHLLAVAHGYSNLKKHDTLADILNAPDRDQLLNWLIKQPLCHYDVELNVIMTHAGVPPCWNLEQTITLAEEAHQLLMSNQVDRFFDVMYSNTPEIWHDDLQGFDRYRTIVNYLTRMRFCKSNSTLDFKQTGAAYKGSKSGFSAWFNYPSKLPKDMHVVFGHWASLEGKTHVKNIHALDTGCVWGNALTALRLDDWQRFRSSSTHQNINKRNDL